MRKYGKCRGYVDNKSELTGINSHLYYHFSLCPKRGEVTMGQIY